MKVRIKSIVSKIGLINRTTLNSLQAKNEGAIIRTFTDAGLQVIGADFGFAWFRTGPGKKFELAYRTKNLPYEPAAPREKGINYNVIRTKSSFFATRLQPRERLIKRFMKSYVIVPVTYRNNTYGNIVLCFKNSKHFSKEEQNLCEALGNAAAQAITIHRLYSSLREFKDRLDRSLDSIIIFDTVSSMIEYVNQGAVRMMQYPENELLKMRMVDVVWPQSREHFQIRIQRLLQGKVKASIFESELIAHGSKPVPVEIFLQLANTAGQPLKFLIIAHNIAKRVLQRRQIQNLLRQKDEFLGIASHELRTPLTTIKGFVQLVQKRLNTSDKSINYFLSKIDSQVDVLTQLVNELLDISRIEVGRLGLEHKQLDINEIVREIVEDLQFTTEKHRLVFNGKIRGYILGDRHRLGQVLVNLITNAIKYSPGGGEINIKLRQSGLYAFLTVKDSGIGISSKHQNHVFEKFFQGGNGDKSAYSGLGLGLFISREIVRSHGGEIWFESQPKQGTTFFVRLPRNNHERRS